MAKELKELLETEVLSDEVKGNIQQAFESKIESVKAEVETEYAARMNEKLAESAETINKLVEEVVLEEVAELKSDIKRYRDIEISYARRLNEFKENYAEKMAEVLEKRLEEQVKAEFEELKDDIQEAKQDRFGKAIFEAFAKTYEAKRLGESEEGLSEKLQSLEKELNETKQEALKLKHEKKVNELLENLEGDKRGIMETLLEKVEYDRLEDRYNAVIDKVLKTESQAEGQEGKQNLSEGKKEIKGKVVIEGDEDSSKNAKVTQFNENVSRLKMLAGIK